MKILIIGGTAFTGPYIVRTLSALGHEVYVYHRGRHLLDPLPAGVRKINAELSSLRAYRDVLRQLKFDLVLHMIAMNRRDAQEAVDAFGGYVQRVVVASSQDVYGAFGALHNKEEQAVAPHPLNEDAPLRTVRHIFDEEYEKLEVEETFVNNAEKLPVTVIRMPATYGPGDARHRFFSYIKRFDDGRPAIILEPKMAHFRWSHGYVENVAEAFVKALTVPHAEGVLSRIYNVGEARFHSDAGITHGAPTVAERVHWLARAAGYKGKIVIVPEDRCPAHLIKSLNFQHDIVVSDARIRAELGYEEIVGMEEGLKRTVAWERVNMPTEFDIDKFNYVAEHKVLRDLGVI